VRFIEQCKDRPTAADGGKSRHPTCRVLCEHGLHLAPVVYYAVRKRPPSEKSMHDGELHTLIASFPQPLRPDHRQFRLPALLSAAPEFREEWLLHRVPVGPGRDRFQHPGHSE